MLHLPEPGTGLSAKSNENESSSEHPNEHVHLGSRTVALMGIIESEAPPGPKPAGWLRWDARAIARAEIRRQECPRYANPKASSC
jgi:hypothetical protein